MESPVPHLNEELSEEHTAGAKTDRVSSDFCGDQRGQKICRTANKAGRQTSASRDLLQSRLRSETTMKETSSQVQRKKFIALITSACDWHWSMATDISREKRRLSLCGFLRLMTRLRR
jgi:hypothetical protein